MPLPQQNFTLTTGGVAENALPARLGRSRLIITALDEDGWVNIGATAATNVGEKLYQGSPSQFSVFNFPTIGGAVSVFSATTGAKFTIRET